jgi:hypothetical protein
MGQGIEPARSWRLVFAALIMVVAFLAGFVILRQRDSRDAASPGPTTQTPPAIADATPGGAATRLATTAKPPGESLVLANIRPTQAAKLINAMAKRTTESWKGILATGDENRNVLLLTGSSPQQVQAAKTFVQDAETNNRWHDLEDQAFDSIFFIYNLKSAKAPDVAAIMDQRHVGLKTPPEMTTGTPPLIVPEPSFVPNESTNALLVTCSKHNKNQIRAEIEALDVAVPVRPQPPAGTP